MGQDQALRMQMAFAPGQALVIIKQVGDGEIVHRRSLHPLTIPASVYHARWHLMSQVSEADTRSNLESCALKPHFYASAHAL